jgi:SanA protein
VVVTDTSCRKMILAMRLLVFAVAIAFVICYYAYHQVLIAATPLPAADQEVGVVLGTSPVNFFGDLNPYFSNRMDAAEELYKQGRVKTLILSGGPGEPEAMQQALEKRGVPPDALILDSKGVDTNQSVLNAAELGRGNPFMVISQRFHVERAIYLAKKHGLHVSGYPAEDPMNPLILFREYLSRVKAVFIS